MGVITTYFVVISTIFPFILQKQAVPKERERERGEERSEDDHDEVFGALLS
jgi:hypothetical protein